MSKSLQMYNKNLNARTYLLILQTTAMASNWGENVSFFKWKLS